MAIPRPFATGGFLRFWRANGGNVAITFALTLPPAAMMGGAAIDYSSAVHGKTIAQDALDSGMLAAAAQSNPDVNFVRRYIAVNLASNQLTLNNATLATSTGNDGSTIYTGDANLSVNTNFVRMIGVNTMSFHVHSEVAIPRQILSTTFQPTLAQGAFSKDIFIFTRDSRGNITSQQTVMTYRYGVAGSGASPAIGAYSQTFNVPAYSTFGVGMLVYQDAPAYSGALVNPVYLYSDVNPSSFVHQTGNCYDPGGAQYNMEDGGNADFMDFVYTMTCTLGAPTNQSVRLRK